MKIRIFGKVPESIVDGPGIRYSLFLQGCYKNCPDCHNPESHSIDGGTEIDTDDILSEIKENPLLSGITFSGGEPMLWPKELSLLAANIHELGLNVWVYTGYTWEELIEEADQNKLDFLKNIDVLVDGPFLKEQRSLELKFKGSKNQRTIDVQKTLAERKITLVF